MSLRITANNSHPLSPLNLMKFAFNCIIISHLFCNLLLAAVMAVPEVAPAATGLTHQLNPDTDNAIMRAVEKRAAPRQYNFGIGKKSYYNSDVIDGDESEDLEESLDGVEGKRADRTDQSRFAFGLGKRAKTEQRFAFGLGKRGPNDNRFQFGLGKRANARDNRFAFGLGKRHNDFDEYIKRRYSFGLGKRSPIDEQNNYSSTDKR